MSSSTLLTTWVSEWVVDKTETREYDECNLMLQNMDKRSLLLVGTAILIGFLAFRDNKASDNTVATVGMSRSRENVVVSVEPESAIPVMQQEVTRVIPQETSLLASLASSINEAIPLVAPNINLPPSVLGISQGAVAMTGGGGGSNYSYGFGGGGDYRANSAEVSTEVSQVSSSDSDNELMQDILKSKFFNPVILDLRVAKNKMAVVFLYSDYTEVPDNIKRQEVIFINPADPKEEPRVLFVPASLREQFGFSSAISPSGDKVITVLHGGRIEELDTKTGDTTLVGIFTYRDDSWPAGDYQHKYAYPAYTLDGKHIIFHAEWDNSLVVVDAVSKDFNKGRVFGGYWISVEPNETNYNLYEFAPDGSSVKFSGKSLDLTQI